MQPIRSTHKTMKYVKDPIKHLKHALADGYMFNKLTLQQKMFVEVYYW